MDSDSLLARSTSFFLSTLDEETLTRIHEKGGKAMVHGAKTVLRVAGSKWQSAESAYNVVEHTERMGSTVRLWCCLWPMTPRLKPNEVSHVPGAVNRFAVNIVESQPEVGIYSSSKVHNSFPTRRLSSLYESHLFVVVGLRLLETYADRCDEC